MKLLQQDGSDCVGDVNYLDELNIHHKSKRRRTAATAAPVPAAADVLDADSSGAQGDRDSEDDNCNETPSDDCDDDAVGDDDERELLSALEEDKEPLSDEDAAFFQDKLLSAQRSSSGARQIRSPSAAAAHNQFQQSHDVNGSAQLYQLYVCGSHRPDNCWPHDLKMSAGSYCRLPSIRAVTHEALLELLHFSVLLHGGTPDCTRAELGAIWQGLRRLLAAVESGELDPDCSMVEVFTTCESAVDMLTKDVRIAEQYAALITGSRYLLRRLRARMVVRLVCVQRHQSSGSPHAVGNAAAHKQAQPGNIMGVTQLPAGQPDDTVQGAVAAALFSMQLLRQLRIALVGVQGRRAAARKLRASERANIKAQLKAQRAKQLVAAAKAMARHKPARHPAPQI